jgi:polar amino acid transport system substrate-binding protein
MRKLTLVLLVLAAAFAAAGCGGDDDDEAAAPATEATTAGEATTAAQADECAKDQLELLNEGTLTIGTDNPAYPPWFGGEEKAPWEISDPTSGEGFESAVAYAIAEELGFAESEVEWVVVPFNQSFRPGTKSFDMDINQISFTEERAEAVDFSDSYYDVNQALVTVEGSDIEDATSVADLKDAKLGAQIGTTSLRYIQDEIQPSQDPSVYDTSNDVISALKAEQIDGIVVDLPTAFYVVAAELDGGVIVGQFPSAGEQERFGIVLEKDSPLTDCVNMAIASLKEDGTLEEIQQEWLSDKVDAPVLQ